eukprot:9469259-Pyramimonas_sp.AAC.1
MPGLVRHGPSPPASVTHSSRSCLEQVSAEFRARRHHVAGAGRELPMRQTPRISDLAVAAARHCLESILA